MGFPSLDQYLSMSHGKGTMAPNSSQAMRADPGTAADNSRIHTSHLTLFIYSTYKYIYIK